MLYQHQASHCNSSCEGDDLVYLLFHTEENEELDRSMTGKEEVFGDEFIGTAIKNTGERVFQNDQSLRWRQWHQCNSEHTCKA